MKMKSVALLAIVTGTGDSYMIQKANVLVVKEVGSAQGRYFVPNGTKLAGHILSGKDKRGVDDERWFLQLQGLSQVLLCSLLVAVNHIALMTERSVTWDVYISFLSVVCT